MAIERSLAIIKPDAFGRGGSVLSETFAAIEKAGLRPVAIEKRLLSKKEAEGFYAVHRERPFFGELTDFMSSGPCLVMVLEGENAIATWRGLLGATNPAEAEEGTLRKRFGTSIGNNAFHGSDATDTAAFEVGYMFSGTDLL